VSELFVELGVEEIPARMTRPALDALAAGIVKLLGATRHGAVHTWGTPRRLAVAVSDVDAVRPGVERLVTGPPVASAWRDGQPGPAAIAFARSKGVEPEQLIHVDTPKGPVVGARVIQGGERTADLVAAGLEAVVAGIPFKKSMRWGTDAWRFVRPLHRVCCVYAGEVVDTTVMGLQTTGTSVGHAIAAADPFPVSDSAHWLANLRERWVLADPHERKAVIARQVGLAAERIGGEASVPEELLEEVTWLVEWPVVLVSQFDPALLELPPRLLVESMKVNQRYFPILREGRLSNEFAVVANAPHGDLELIAAGNARVLAARFHDARFFFGEDRKKSLAEHGERLGGMTWLKGLGTVADRQARLTQVAAALAERFGADRDATRTAASLCKADLCTQMVGEFPELQGHVGRLLAGFDGHPPVVALAIEGHYHPRFATDSLPPTPEGRAVAVADRLVLLEGAFRVGLQPTASADPQGLRRAALGVVQILLDAEVDGELHALFAAAGLPASDELVDFFLARLRAFLVSEGLPADLVDAVASAGGADLTRIAARARGLGALVRAGEFGPIRTTFRRVAGLAKDHPDRTYRLDLFDGEAEYQLHLALSRLPPGDAPVPQLLAALTELRPVVDTFFDRVLVMSEDPDLRANRLGLLRAIVDRFAGFADFARLSVE